MIKDCIEIGDIQAFLDGELSPRETANVTAHTAICSNCAQLLAEADEENVLAFSALDRELDTLVPTQRLWSRISDSIEQERERVSIWNRLYSFLNVNVATPSFAAAAGVLLVFGLTFAVVTMDRGPVDIPAGTDVAVSSGELKVTAIDVPPVDSEVVRPVQADPVATKPQAQFASSNHSAKELKRIVTPAARPEYLKYEYLPGEESYIKTIGELERNTVAHNASLRAGGQVAYQRDLAVVEDSIKKMKVVVKKNPGNQAARQVLYSAYQDKIDLLNSAAQRDELMASLDYRQ
jgi:Predicted transmembrane transcriptional regulator (anti-sigma factor)